MRGLSSPLWKMVIIRLKCYGWWIVHQGLVWRWANAFSPQGRFPVAQQMITQQWEPLLHQAPPVCSTCPSLAMGATFVGTVEELTEQKWHAQRLTAACANRILCFSHREIPPLSQVSLPSHCSLELAVQSPGPWDNSDSCSPQWDQVRSCTVSQWQCTFYHLSCPSLHGLTCCTWWKDLLAHGPLQVNCLLGEEIWLFSHFPTFVTM